MINSRYGWEHRVYRVPGFLSSRPNWLPRPRARKRVLPPPPLVPGGTHSLAGERARESIRTKGQTLWNSRYNPSTVGGNKPLRAELLRRGGGGEGVMNLIHQFQWKVLKKIWFSTISMLPFYFLKLIFRLRWPMTISSTVYVKKFFCNNVYTNCVIYFKMKHSPIQYSLPIAFEWIKKESY